jgi:hypothetical protein
LLLIETQYCSEAVDPVDFRDMVTSEYDWTFGMMMLQPADAPVAHP